tara:strand:+ start:4756 stop:6306 length:1551 start_codon:yes stop_codon:yes gene_type:complete
MGSNSDFFEKNNKGYLYYLRLKIHEKKYYKIGFTKSDSVYKRFSHEGSIDYEYIEEVLFFHYFDNAFEIEESLHKFLKRELGADFYPAKEYPFYKNGQSEIYPEDVLTLAYHSLSRNDMKHRDSFLDAWTKSLPLYTEKFTKPPIDEFKNRPIFKLAANIYRAFFGVPIVRKRIEIRSIDSNYYVHKRAYLNAISLIHGCLPLRDYNTSNDPMSWLGYSNKQKPSKPRGYPYPIQSSEWYEELWSWADELEISEGILPRNLDELTSLEELNLYFNTSDPIYISQHLGRLTKLKKLTISGCKIVNFPVELGDLINLIYLNICGGCFYILPDSIGNLSKLETLELIEGQLIELPETIGKLKNIRKLDLGANKIESLPSTIGDLCNLEELGLGGVDLEGGTLTRPNPICFLPKEFVKLDRLKILEMGPGYHSGIMDRKISAPKVIFKLNNIEYLSTEFLLDDRICDVKKMKKLTRLEGQFERYDVMKKNIIKLKKIPNIHFYSDYSYIVKENGIIKSSE